MAANPIDFSATELFTSVAAVSATIAAGTVVNLGEYHATAIVEVHISDLANVFQFWTDALDVVNTPATDLKFKFMHNMAADAGYVMLGSDINLNGNCFIQKNDHNTTSTDIDQMLDQPITVGDNVLTYDYVRFLAKKLFGYSNGVDLFSNEEELRTSLQSSFISSFKVVTDSLTRNDTFADSQVKSIADTIFNQLVLSDGGKDRLTTLQLADGGTDSAPGEGNWYKVPLAIGDTLSFILKIAPADNQHTLTNVGTIPDHLYRIKFNIVP
jgi:hypothetical protein